MPIDPDQHAAVRDALDAADTLDASAVDIAAEGDSLVLRGSVATYEEASAAVSIAEQHADAVASQIRVDVNLREGLPDESAAGAGPDDALRGSSFDPADGPADVVDDLQQSLSENIPWEPPHEAVEVPTRAEQRGVADRSGHEDGAAAVDGGGEKSLPDLSPEELARAAHPSPRDEETA